MTAFSIPQIVNEQMKLQRPSENKSRHVHMHIFTYTYVYIHTYIHTSYSVELAPNYSPEGDILPDPNWTES